MEENVFPLPYRWVIARHLTDWTPWHFEDDMASISLAPNLEKNEFARRAFHRETGADFDVYLFARRQDMDEFAFFTVTDGRLDDDVITIHLSFSNHLELRAPLEKPHLGQTRGLMKWIREVAIRDAEEWMSEEDLLEIPST